MEPAAARPPFVAFSLGPEPIPPAGAARARLVATVAGAAARGLIGIDLSESPVADAAWTVAREGLGPRWRESTLFVAEDPKSIAPADRPGSTVVLRSPATARSGEVPPGFGGVRYDNLDGAEVAGVAAVRGGAAWVSFPGSLLDAPRLIPLLAALREAGGSVLLTDPHAGGRLDGRWLSEGPAAGSPRPVDIAELERAYAPVLALRFLTEGRRRTLPQAAVAFALAVGATPSVRFRDLGQVEAFGRADDLEPITEAELRRLAAG